MTHRCDMPAPRGTLFKQPREIKRNLRPLPRAPRDAEHIEAIRQCPCVACGQDPAGEAAHLRMGNLAGLGRKPEDRYVTPLCRACHQEQHSLGELTFWTSLGLAPTILAERLWRAQGNVEMMRAMVMVVLGERLAGGGK